MTIAYDVNNASLIIQDGAENADVRRNTLAEKVTLAYHRNPTEYHRNPKIMCCVLLTSSAMSMLWRNQRGTIVATVRLLIWTRTRLRCVINFWWEIYVASYQAVLRMFLSGSVMLRNHQEGGEISLSIEKTKKKKKNTDECVHLRCDNGGNFNYFSFFLSHKTPRAPQPNPQSSLTPKKHLNSDWVRVWWNPVNKVSNGSKQNWPYYRGRLKFHDLRAIMTNTPYSAFTFLEQLFSLINNRNVNIAYGNRKKLLKISL